MKAAVPRRECHIYRLSLFPGDTQEARLSFGRAVATVDNKAQQQTANYNAQRFIRMLMSWRELWETKGRPTVSHSDGMKQFKLMAVLGMEDPAFLTKLVQGQLSTRIKVRRACIDRDRYGSEFNRIML